MSAKTELTLGTADALLIEGGDRGRFENLNLGAEQPESVGGRALVILSTDGNKEIVACGVIGRSSDPVFELPFVTNGE